jgi:hypothetical protein
MGGKPRLSNSLVKGSEAFYTKDAVILSEAYYTKDAVILSEAYFSGVEGPAFP